MKRSDTWQTMRGLTLLRGWVRMGLEEGKIAERMGIPLSTLDLWKKKYPAIRDALDDTIDYQVEDALLKKALGYENVERKVEISAKGERKEVETVKQVGPDMSAISLWLKKRKPEQWGELKGGVKKENNLPMMLEELGKGEEDAIPELQSQTAADDDMVEAGEVQAL